MNKKLPDFIDDFELGMKDAFDKIPKANKQTKNYYSGYDYGLEVLKTVTEKNEERNIQSK